MFVGLREKLQQLQASTPKALTIQHSLLSLSTFMSSNSKSLPFLSSLSIGALDTCQTTRKCPRHPGPFSQDFSEDYRPLSLTPACWAPIVNWRAFLTVTPTGMVFILFAFLLLVDAEI